MANQEITPPETLYRGVTLPAGEVRKEVLTGDLTPGKAPIIDEQGQGVDATGNEHGVYMSDNPHMVDRSYANEVTGDDIEDSPVFSTRHRSHIRVQTPRIGVVHTINTNGLEVRPPKLSDAMQGVRNNGFKGNEWIADVVPADKHRVSRLRVGPDLLHPERVIEVGEDAELDEAIGTLEAEIAARAGRLALAKAMIAAMPADRRHDWRAVESVLAALPASSDEQQD
jgi:hypothetical protein